MVEVVALVSALIVAFVVAYLATPSVGEDSTRGAVSGALALGAAAFLACGAIYGAPRSPLRLDDWVVILAGLAAFAAPVERAIGADRPVRVHAVRALLGALVGAGLLSQKLGSWPLNLAAGAAVAAGGWVYLAALLLDGAVDRRPLWAGVHAAAWAAVTSAFLVGPGNINAPLVGGALVLALVGLLCARRADLSSRTDDLLRGAPLVLAAVLGALVLRAYVYSVAQDRPPLACLGLLLAAAVGPRVGDLLRPRLGARAEVVGLVLLLACGGAAAALAAPLGDESAYSSY